MRSWAVSVDSKTGLSNEVTEKVNVKRFVFSHILFTLAFLSAVSASSVDTVNRRTAVRCLKLAESYLSSNDYGNALSQAELGLSYDESVADLWYIKAAAKSGLMEPKAEILPLVMKAMTEGGWVDYNRDGARILYADLLCDMGNYDQAVAILDSKPFIYSSDAEFIRIKAYYCMRTADSIVKARDKINSARKIYPLDMRFPHVFFKYEYDLHRDSEFDSFMLNESSELLVQKIADSFIAKMPEYDNPDANLEIYSAMFASGEKQTRMVQAFSAHGMKHPLYALLALKCGIMEQQEAWDYFCSFADKEVSLSMLEDILALISDEVTVESVKEHLNAFSGTLLIDTDFDCNPNLFVSYFRGRPKSFFWDKNNDGINEWNCECDFGVPESIFLTQGNIQLFYGTYPAIVKAIYKSESIAADHAVFNIMDETLFWTPFSIEPLESVKELFGMDFFLPVINADERDLEENKILYSCSSYEIASDEKPGAKIVFSVLNGFPESAVYYSLDKIYARALFEDGFPSVRSVDNDDDGIFETVETFGYDPENTLGRNAAEQEQVMTNLFGLPMRGSGIYLRMIQIDSNGDTVPDFTEEFIAGNGKISSWDYDADRNWDVRYKRYPREKDEDPLIEDSQFYTEPSHILVTVSTWNGNPVKVQFGETFYPVVQGENKNFYWLGDAGTYDDEKTLLGAFDFSAEQGVCELIESGEKRIQVVRIGEKLYSFIIPSVESENAVENAHEAE